MSTRNHLHLVVDEVVSEARAVAHRRAGESAAVKVAEAMPRTPVARGLRVLAASLREIA